MLHVRLSAFMLAVLVALGGIPSGAGADATKFDDRLLQVMSDTDGPVGAIVTTHGAPQAAADAARSLGADVLWVYDIIDGFSLQASKGVLDILSLRSDVERIWLDRAMTTVMDTSAYAIESDKAWAAGIDGSGLSVAVIDTGIDSLHPFFSGAISACVSTIGGLVSPECADSDGHGTHVAGTVASRDSTYPGVAPGASLAVVRVLHAVGAGTSGDIIKGIEWVKNNQANVNPPIKVATMSIGFLDPDCGDGSGPEADAANALVASGVPFTIAAGNSGHDSCTIDGASAAADVITVAAVDDQGTVTQDDDVIADFSSGGGDQLDKPDISYPGVDITSAYIGAGVLIATLSGTSMATPHAAGVAALVRQNEPGLSAQQVKDRITGTAVKTSNTGSSWNSVYGHGLGNACTALQLSGCGSTGGGGNSAPIAAFTYTCTDLACDFDGTGSSDSDGTIASYAWDFGDGSTGSGATVTHSFAAEGTYTVILTVTDDGGASDTESKAIDVVDSGGSGISLSASGYKVRGAHHVDLTWSGATSTSVDVYRDGAVVATTANDGAYTDAIGAKGGGSYTHKVCEAGTSTCSNSVTTTF